jgi:hypothetical protein
LPFFIKQINIDGETIKKISLNDSIIILEIFIHELSWGSGLGEMELNKKPRKTGRRKKVSSLGGKEKVLREIGLKLKLKLSGRGKGGRGAGQ